jgi:hypothetical protein
MLPGGSLFSRDAGFWCMSVEVARAREDEGRSVIIAFILSILLNSVCSTR